MHLRYWTLTACIALYTSAYAGQPPVESGMLFAHMMPKPKEPSENKTASSLEHRPAASMSSITSSKASIPTAWDLNSVIVPLVPSAEPASFEQHNALRVQAWKAQQEQERRRQEQQELAAQRDANRPQVVIIQQPARDPIVDGFLAIPRMLGYLFGGKTVRN